MRKYFAEFLMLTTHNIWGKKEKEWKYPKIGNGKRVRLLEKYSGHAIFGQVFMADRHETMAAAATSENAPFSACLLTT